MDERCVRAAGATASRPRQDDGRPRAPARRSGGSRVRARGRAATVARNPPARQGRPPRPGRRGIAQLPVPAAAASRWRRRTRGGQPGRPDADRRSRERDGRGAGSEVPAANWRSSSSAAKRDGNAAQRPCKARIARDTDRRRTRATRRTRAVAGMPSVSAIGRAPRPPRAPERGLRGARRRRRGRCRRGGDRQAWNGRSGKRKKRPAVAPAATPPPDPVRRRRRAGALRAGRGRSSSGGGPPSVTAITASAAAARGASSPDAATSTNALAAASLVDRRSRPRTHAASPVQSRRTTRRNARVVPATTMVWNGALRQLEERPATRSKPPSGPTLPRTGGASSAASADAASRRNVRQRPGDETEERAPAEIARHVRRDPAAGCVGLVEHRHLNRLAADRRLAEALVDSLSDDQPELLGDLLGASVAARVRPDEQDAESPSVSPWTRSRNAAVDSCRARFAITAWLTDSLRGQIADRLDQAVRADERLRAALDDERAPRRDSGPARDA